MKNLFISFICSISLISIVSLHAQNNKIYFEKYGIAEGIPEEAVASLLEDSQGYIWMTTQNGLVRYDGYQFKVFKYGEKKGDLKLRSTLNLTEGANGRIWIGSAWNSLGLAIYDPYKASFQNFLYDPEDPASMPLEYAIPGFEDQSGNLWFCNLDRKEDTSVTCRLDLKTQQIYCYQYKWNTFKSWDTSYKLQEGKALELTIDSSIWLLDDSNNILRWKADLDSFEIVIPSHGIPELNFKDSINAITSTKEGKLLISGKNGLYVWDPVTMTFMDQYKQNLTGLEGLANGSVIYAFEDPKGQYWAMHEGGNISIVDPKTKKYIQYKYGGEESYSDLDLKNSEYLFPFDIDHGKILFLKKNKAGWIPSNMTYLEYDFTTQSFQGYTPYFENTPLSALTRILDLKKDRTGLLWIGSRPNLYKEAPKRQSFEIYKPAPSNPDALPSNFVTCFLEDKAGNFWVGTDKGLRLFNKERKQFEQVPSYLNALSNAYIRRLLEDSQGNLWVGTIRGLFCWRPGQGLIKQSKVTEGAITGIMEDSQQNIWIAVERAGVFQIALGNGEVIREHKNISIFAPSIYEDSQKNIWVHGYGGNSPGLYKLSRGEQNFQSFAYMPDDSTTITDNNIIFVREDSKGRLWVATESGLLSQYLFKEDRFISYGNKKSFGFGNLTFHEDSQGELWIGTSSSDGLALLDPKSGEFTFFGEKEGILHNDMDHGLFDNGTMIYYRDRLWIPSPRGLSIFNTTDKTFQNFRDIQLEPNFWPFHHQYYQTRNNDIWVASRDGLYRISPDELLKRDSIPPQVWITSVNINGQSFEGPDGEIFQQAVSFTREISLPYWQKDLTFDFVALHYLDPKNNQYAWKLDNYDKNWTAPSKERKATYTNLSPGTYTFRVKGSNADGIWNEEEAFMKVTILPPWWQTNWAYLAYILLVGLGIWTFLRWRTESLRNQRNELRQRVDQRTQELSHKISELQTVNDISKAAVSRIEVVELVKTIGALMQENFNADFAHIALLDREKEWIDFTYQHGESLPRIPFGQGLTSRIITKNEPLLIHKEVGKVYEEFGLPVVGELPASYIGVPIPSGGEVIGVLSVQRKDPGHLFTTDDQRLLTTIASNIGVAINNARLFEEAQKARQEALASEAMAKEANEAKSSFLSTVSHELRTPLTSILGFAKIIKKRFTAKVIPQLPEGDTKLDKTVNQINDNLDVVIKEGERLTTLINDVLDLAKIEAGRIEWHLEDLNMGEVIKQAHAATSSLFDAKKLAYEMDLPKELPVVVADKDKMIQVMINLLSNAVKFTEKGLVFTRAQVQNEALLVSVTDTGIGIAEKDLPKVFDKFRQVGDTLTDKPKGTGLGLPICKEIVEQQGGRIWLESEEGTGSTFYFSLPLKNPGEPLKENIYLDDLIEELKKKVPTATALLKDKKDQHILVVDDEASIRELLRQELSEIGYQISLAENGKKALQMIRNQQPDMIILDVMMPELNGFDLAAILKNDPKTMEIPILILSIVQDKERGYRIGVDRYLNKPIDTDLLLKEIESLLTQGISSKKVIVVDENASAIRTVSEVLTARGYQVMEADGKDLLKKAKDVVPDVIILSVLLDGREEIIKSIRFEKGLENVLFLVYQ